MAAVPSACAPSRVTSGNLKGNHPPFTNHMCLATPILDTTALCDGGRKWKNEGGTRMTSQKIPLESVHVTLYGNGGLCRGVYVKHHDLEPSFYLVPMGLRCNHISSHRRELRSFPRQRRRCNHRGRDWNDEATRNFGSH